MAVESKLRELINQVKESLNEQEWFQELKGKWEDLDPQSKLYVKGGVLLGGCGLLLFSIISVVSSVNSVKSEYIDKTELLNLVRTANEEVRTLKERTGSRATGNMAQGDWKAYVTTVAAGAGVTADHLKVETPQKGVTTETTEESLVQVKLEDINVKQLVKLAFQLENGNEPVKLRNMVVKTKGAEGYLTAELHLSGFKLIEEKK